MDFDKLKQNWQQLGATDPRWAILGERAREGGGLDDESFWRGGVEFVGWVAQHLAGLGALPPLGRALDFGCGHGRLTQGLAPHFAEVVGVDIAASMLDVARHANRHADRVSYVLNERPDLAVFPDASFDFVLTVLVLQHMRPDYAAGYLREFMRVLRPGGVAFFQVPIESLAPIAGAKAVASAMPAVPAARLQAFTTILPPLLFLAADAWQWMRVSIHNAGSRALPSSGTGGVELGLRFERYDGTVASPIAWTPLPHDIAPGASASLLVPVRMPATPGSYQIAVVPCVSRAWFAQPDNVPATCLVVVSPAPGGVAAPAPPPIPARATEPPTGHLIEVHGTSCIALQETIRAAGGEFVDVSLDAWGGYEWVSAHCVVRKR